MSRLYAIGGGCLKMFAISARDCKRLIGLDDFAYTVSGRVIGLLSLG